MQNTFTSCIMVEIHPPRKTPQLVVILNSRSPVDDFEFRSDQFLPVSNLHLVQPFTSVDSVFFFSYIFTRSLKFVLFFSLLLWNLRCVARVFQYLESIFGLLFKLLQEVTECDTKMHVLHVISCVIERVNTQVRRWDVGQKFRLTSHDWDVLLLQNSVV